MAPAGSDFRSGTRAISGIASSARHCVSADAANVHSIGWVPSGTGYTVTFDADFPLVAAMSRLDLNEKRSTSSFGTPELRFTASTSGTMALYVGGNRQAGCYRYKVEIRPPTASTVSTSASHASRIRGSNMATNSFGGTAISGLASSAKHCVAGNFVSNVHEIGRVEQDNRVTITFDGDFDAVAGATILNMETQRGTFLTDDNSGGGVQPRLDFNTSQAGTVALFVAGVNGAAGCYRYKVEIR